MKHKKGTIKKVMIVIIALTLVIACLAFYGVQDVISFPTKQIKEDCKVETYEYNNRKVFKISPKEGKISNKKILYFHGGAYMAEMTQDHWEFIEKLVIDTGVTVILPDYPLAPKYNYKDVFAMVKPLYEEIVNKVNTDDLIMMGDSAGGGLCLALLEDLDEQIPVPSKTIVISPWLDISMTNEKMKEVEKFDNDLSIDKLKLAAIAYSGGMYTQNYLLSPIYGDVSKLKNVTILTGTYDILNPDVYELEDKIVKTGGSIKIKTYEKAGHIWIIKSNSDKKLVDEGYKDLLEGIENE